MANEQRDKLNTILTMLAEAAKLSIEFTDTEPPPTQTEFELLCDMWMKNFATTVAVPGKPMPFGAQGELIANMLKAIHHAATALDDDTEVLLGTAPGSETKQ